MFGLKFKAILPVVALLALGTAAYAEKKETRVADGLTPKQFATNCDNMGGQIDEGSGGENTVQCTLPNGTNADCSFGPKDAYCEVTTPRSSIPVRTIKGLMGDATTQVMK